MRPCWPAGLLAPALDESDGRVVDDGIGVHRLRWQIVYDAGGVRQSSSLSQAPIARAAGT